MWSYAIALTPSNGFSNPGYVYTLRATCENSGGDVEYGSYGFALKHDQYVALGDSYSSGLGSFDYYDDGTCNRSFDGYPFQVADDAGLDAPYHVACAGAVTDDLFEGILSLPSPPFVTFDGQLSQLTSDTQYVTLTIGGNDLGFSHIVDKCVDRIGSPGWSCSTNSVMEDMLDVRLNALAGTSSGSGVGPDGKDVHSITSILSAIHQASPNAKIYIAGYPHLFGENTSKYVADGDAPGGYKCIVNGTFGASVSLWDAQFLNNAADNLNEIIEEAVADATQTPSSIDATYVDPIQFNGHGICDSGSPYLNDVLLYSTLDPKPESFHPNLDGMQSGYGAAFVSAMSN